MRRCESKFLLGVLLFATSVSANAKAINLSNTTTAESVDGRSAASMYAGSFAQKSYGDMYQIRSSGSQEQGNGANVVHERANAAVSDADLWLMLIVGFGLVLLQLRRKQRLLSQQTLGMPSRDKAVS